MDAFVYGTLTDPERAASVVTDATFRGPAVLSGLHRVDGEYPTLAPGGRVEGRLLSTADVAALDRYEGVDRGLYVRVSVPYEGAALSPEDGESQPVQTYVGDPEKLDAPAEWPGEGAFADRVREYVRSRGVTVRDR